MPNIRSQIVGDLSSLGTPYIGARGFHITFSDGRSITLTKVQILAHFVSETGTRVQKRNKTLQWIKDQIVSGGGQEQIDPNNVSHDFDDVTGEITNLEVS